jgi:hypothetical protein
VRHLVSGRALAHVRVMSIAAGEMALRLPAPILDQLVKEVNAIEQLHEQRYTAFAEVGTCKCKQTSLKQTGWIGV